MKINVGVLYGGNSTEHEISVISAVQAMNNMDKEKYNIIPIYLTKDSIMYTADNFLDMKTYKNINLLKKNSKEVILTRKGSDVVLLKLGFPNKVVSKIDIVFPIMHGYNTEDGCIAGFLEVLGVPYCECDIYGAVIGQDKIFQKMVLRANDINVVDYFYTYDTDYEENPKKVFSDAEKLGYPLIVKPSRQGSSVGITIAHDKKELEKAIEEAIEYDDKILIEKVVENMKELNCSVIADEKGYEASPIEEVYGKDEILSYKDKYLSGGKSSKTSGSKGMASAGRKIPADIKEDLIKTIEDMSIRACKALKTNGVVRIDYLMDQKSGKVYLNEMNITPGSLSFYLWDAKGLKYKDLLDRIINAGIKRYQEKSKKLSSFDTNILETFNGAKGVKK